MKAIELAECIDFPSVHLGHEAAAELRRLHEVNQELLEVLKLALDSHGKLLLSDPPQDPWKLYRVEEKARAAIAKAEGKA